MALCYFFLGAPSAEDNSPQTCLMVMARGCAMRAGPAKYSVRFISVSLFPIKKVGRVKCNDGQPIAYLGSGKRSPKVFYERWSAVRPSSIHR